MDPSGSQYRSATEDCEKQQPEQGNQQHVPEDIAEQVVFKSSQARRKSRFLSKSCTQYPESCEEHYRLERNSFNN